MLDGLCMHVCECVCVSVCACLIPRVCLYVCVPRTYLLCTCPLEYAEHVYFECVCMCVCFECVCFECVCAVSVCVL